VHHRDIQDESKSLSEGEAVTFELTQGPKGRKATNVHKG
jgi:cold shock CspA family protein